MLCDMFLESHAVCSGPYLVLPLADMSVLCQLVQFSNGCLLGKESGGFTAPIHLSLLLDNDWQLKDLTVETPQSSVKPITYKMLL